MKKFLAILLLAVLGLTGCQGKGKEEPKPAEPAKEEAVEKTAEGEVKNPIDSNSRIDLLENKVTLVVPEGNPKKSKHLKI